MYQLSYKTIILISFLSAIFAGGVVAIFENLQNSNGQTRPRSQATSTDFHLKDVEGQEANNEVVYDTVSPGVVNISSTSYVQGFFEVYSQQGTGSGSIIDDQGHILTNYHVVQGAQQLDVALADKSHYKAKVIGTDPSNDMAVIKIDAPAEKLHVVKLGASSDLKIGQKVLAIGNPFGLERTLTTGIISGLGRPLRAPDGRLIESVIQTDAAINPGNSGGPLLNSKGEMIGINSAIYSPQGEGGGFIGIGFAVPVDKAKELIPDLIALGHARKPWIGIATYPMNERIAEQFDFATDKGLMVTAIAGDSPAERAGLKVGTIPVSDGRVRFNFGGDIIVKIDNKDIENTDDFTSVLNKHKIGDTVDVEIVRGTRHMTIPVKLGEQPVSSKL
ncbi:MAG TPA: trypsin-like peptidase domain-containing protein [Blastocatellia bacterium]|nr:trypsin-like peptidase domain-containing protein [Blastocatellia bacterium]